MIYRTITTGIDEQKRLEVDEILGSTAARVRIKEVRRETASAAGFEVG